MANGKWQMNETPEETLRRLQWTVLKPLAAALGGNERSLVRASAADITEVRAYQPGDDIRHIDWNISARLDEPFVRESYEARALDVWLLVDVSPSVQWGTVKRLKIVHAIDFAVAAGYVLGRQGNRVGAMAFAQQPFRFVQPASGQRHWLRLIRELREAAHEQLANRGQVGKTQLKLALDEAARAIQSKSLVFVISDFLGPHDWMSALRHLDHRHEVVAVRLLDPREETLPDLGLLTFADAETGQQLMVNTHDPKLRERYQQAAQTRTQQLRKDIAVSGADLIELNTNEELLSVLTHFLGRRRLQRGARAK